MSDTVIALLPSTAGRQIVGGLMDRVLTPAFINLAPADVLLLATLLLLIVVTVLLAVVVRQRRALRRSGQATPPPAEPRRAAGGIVTVRAPASRGTVAHAWLVSSIAAAREATAQLAANPDFASFDRLIGLGTALSDLDLAAGPASSNPLAAALRDGLAQSGWLQRIFRAELVLEALAAQGTAWSALGRALAAIGSAARLELATTGIEVIRPCLLAPVQRGYDVADEGLSELRQVVFVNRAVRSAVSGVPEPAVLVVDCLRCGTREIEAGSPVPRVTPALVVLFAPMLWRAAAPS